MEFKELKTLPKSELEKLLAQNREKMKELRFNLAFGKVKDISEIKKTKKTIAQILTLLNTQKDGTKKSSH
ncbi:MAG TPA: 50S ribosomal protein L29 [Candidatus Paceibacterota bacterium]|nr:50S ribosomal protein L29 [Candidatus Paceibacterota bacterium]HOK20609.1 50S ribosomal protein L29 [Candidatus Paceibacterota bacterium]HOL54011.1 50S ribosomal protein L29 [Candidatus Paceibacterota bacterium]HON21761.1 50S ribosomal protein L29 [Candidatus Paceibacterota bacterium]HOV88595.1 50S ribosomal protein L29 [Candidatus Paceibacterota bacterium]